MNPLLRPWRQVFNFSGRASRREYALFHLGVVALYLVLTTLTGVGAALAMRFLGQPAGAPQLLALVWLVETALTLLMFVIGHLSVSVRRLHDRNEPWLGWLLTLIPLVGLFFWVPLAFARGTDGENDYGHDPRYPAPVSTADLGNVFS